jgi:ABC-type lipoprotein release transport system permease subunit
MLYFLCYALIIAVLGSALGILPGQWFSDFFMVQILEAYELPPLAFYMDWPSLFTAALASAASCVGAVMITLVREVRTGPADCMRPKPPKKSRRNIVERSPLWLIMGFSAKTVVRNIFRNRMRALMCVIGVSLCMALVITGLGASDTFVTFSDNLFKTLYRYDLQVALGDAASGREERHIARMEGVEKLESEMAQPVEAFALEKRQDTLIHVLEDEATLMVIDQTAEDSMIMPADGVFVAEQFARDTGLTLGDRLSLRLIGTRKMHTLPVRGIAPNISGIYIGRTLWRALGEGFRPSVLYLLARDPEGFKRTLEEYDFVQSVSLKQELVTAMDENLASNNVVSLMLIVSGGVLAFAVLYSLGIMNFYDRIRDLATLSVLGFYPKEIRRLILTENLIFTIFGIGLGALLGLPLLTNILGGESADELTFVPIVLPMSYAISAALTFGFSLIVNFFLGRKTKKIDMLGALKSVE